MLFGGLIGVLCWIGAIIMFMLFGAMVASNPASLLVIVPAGILLVRWSRRRFERWVASAKPTAGPERVSGSYSHDWLMNSPIAKSAGLHKKYLAELAFDRKGHKPSPHDTDEPITIGGHIRHHHE